MPNFFPLGAHLVQIPFCRVSSAGAAQCSRLKTALNFFGRLGRYEKKCNYDDHQKYNITAAIDLPVTLLLYTYSNRTLFVLSRYFLAFAGVFTLKIYLQRVYRVLWRVFIKDNPQINFESNHKRGLRRDSEKNCGFSVLIVVYMGYGQGK